MQHTDQAEHDQRDGDVVDQLVGGVAVALAVNGQQVVYLAQGRGGKAGFGCGGVHGGS